MQALPHLYKVQSASKPNHLLTASSKGIPDLTVAGPAEFGGPGDQWSPESLLLSAVSNCLILSFKAVATIDDFSWINIECETLGKLDKVDRVMSFTEITSQMKLVISDLEAKEKALKLLKKAESICIVSNTLNAKLAFECEVVIQA